MVLVTSSTGFRKSKAMYLTLGSCQITWFEARLDVMIILDLIKRDQYLEAWAHEVPRLTTRTLAVELGARQLHYL